MTGKKCKTKNKPDHEGNIITHSRKWQELELQLWKVTSGVLQHGFLEGDDGEADSAKCEIMVALSVWEGAAL